MFRQIKFFETLKKIVVILDVISFLLSNLIVYYLVTRFIDIGPWFTLGIFFFALILIKLDLLFSLPELLDKQSTQTPEGPHQKIRKKIWLTIPLILVRLVFLNTIQYLLFTLIVWVFAVGVLLMFGYATLLSKYSSEFYNAIGLVGILAGFFQYYTQRYETKTQNNLISKFNKLLSSCDKKISIDNFRRFIEKNGTRFSAFNVLLKKTINLSPYYLSRLPGKSINVYSLNFASEQEKYRVFEDSVKDSTKKELLGVYSEFFNEKKAEIIEEINKEKIASELIEMLLSNINFFAEAKSDLIGIKEQNLEESTNAEEFIANMRFSIFDEVLTNCLFENNNKKNSNESEGK